MITYLHKCPECGYSTYIYGTTEWCEACGWGNEPDYNTDEEGDLDVCTTRDPD